MIRLFYTGASSDLKEQRLSVKSLGGFISSSPVDNGVSEAFFSDLSQTSIAQDLPEYRMFALKNEGSSDITNLKIYYEYKEENPSIDISFAAIEPSKSNNNGGACIFTFEKIPNGNSAPIYSQKFYSADSSFASQKVFLATPAITGEKITFLGVQTKASSGNLSLTDTYKLIEKAFKNNENYLVQYVLRTDTTRNPTTGDELTTTTEYLFVKRMVIGENNDPITFTTTPGGNASLKESYNFEGGSDNSQSLGTLKAGAFLGIWLKKTLNEDVILNQPVVPLNKVKQDLGTDAGFNLFFEW